MNSRFTEAWLALPLWQRGAIFVLSGCLLAAASWFLWVRPASQLASGLASKRLQEARHYQATLRQLHKEGPIGSIADDVARLEASAHEEKEGAFSPLELLEKAGGQLVFWQPDNRGGNLTLLLSWKQVKNVLLCLSEHRAGIELRHFNLRRENERLRLQITLVMADET